MTRTTHGRTSTHSTRRGLVLSLAISCLAVGAFGGLAVALAMSVSTGDVLPDVVRVPGGAQGETAEPGEADGVLPHGATVLDEELAGIRGLDADLLSALRRATADAADDEYEIQINSGWRSAGLQSHLLEQAIDEHGSEEEAARWVATAETSSHVTGEAVDIAPYDAIDWLSRHGDAYGLCQVYGNESWHFELRPEAAEEGCPPTYPDATHDPRWQQ